MVTYFGSIFARWKNICKAALVIYNYFHLKSKRFGDQFSQHQWKTRDIYLLVAPDFTLDSDWNSQDHLYGSPFPPDISYLKNDCRLSKAREASRNATGKSIWHLPPGDTVWVTLCQHMHRMPRGREGKPSWKLDAQWRLPHRCASCPSPEAENSLLLRNIC